MSTRAAFLTTLALAMLSLVIGASSALATTIPSADVGNNVGGWLSGLGKDLLIPIAGLFGIGALFRRDVGHALLIGLIAIIVGIFVYTPSGASNIINSVASTLTK